LAEDKRFCDEWKDFHQVHVRTCDLLFREFEFVLGIILKIVFEYCFDTKFITI
jgi:hypothetical protein